MYSYCLNNWRPCLHDEVLLLDVLTDSSPSTWSSGKKKKINCHTYEIQNQGSFIAERGLWGFCLGFFPIYKCTPSSPVHSLKRKMR